MSVTSSVVLLFLAVDVTTGISRRYGNGLNQDGYPWENFKNRAGNTVDRRKLLNLYALMCPVPEPCGATNYYGLELRTTKETSDMIYKSCKQCECYDKCLTFNSCCPDLTAAFMKHECVDTALYKSPYWVDTPTIEEVHIVRTNPEEDDQYDDTKAPGETIFYTSNNWNLMVSSCPQGATEEQIMYCNAGKTVPVSSNTSQISYRNKHCASCNHDDSNLVNWKVTFVCSETMEEVKFGSHKFETKMEQNNCVVKYDPQQTDLETGVNPPSYPCNYRDVYTYKLDHCNVTGLWSTYDPDIEWACEHLNLAYKWRYKNVFCYICNPSLVSTHSEIIYDRCNVTGRWKGYDAHDERGCLTFPSVQRLAPFKNVYCIRCNGYIRINKVDMVKEYGLSRINEIYVTGSRPVPPVTIYLQMKGDDLVEKSREAFQFISPDFQSFPYDVKREVMTQTFAEANKSFLYDAYFDACGYERLCNNYSSQLAIATDKLGMNEQCISCSCKSDCAANDDCCIDLIVEQMPYTCIEEPRLLTVENFITDFKPDEGASMTVIDKCLNRADVDLIDRCETDHFNRSDILQYSPVFQEGIYKNLFCLMCNVPHPEPVFTINIVCNSYLETALAKTMSQLFEVVRKQCKTQLVPAGYDRFCGKRGNVVEDLGIISYCNRTGLWLNYDERIAAGCEEDEHSLVSFMPIYTLTLNNVSMRFKNYLCFLCNPQESEVTAPHIYDSCNKDHWTTYDPDLNKVCRETSLVPSWLPYKNVYCYLCNRPLVPNPTFTERVQPTPADMSTQFDVELGSTYRMMFTLTPKEWSNFYPDGSDPNAVCSLGFSYDYSTKTCRVILCSSDRVLLSDECIHMSQLIPTGGANISLDVRLDSYNPPILFETVDFNKHLLIEFILGKVFMSLRFLCNKFVSRIESFLGAEGMSVKTKMCAIITSSACAMYDASHGTDIPAPPLVLLRGYVRFYVNLEVAYYNNVRDKSVLEVLNHVFKKPYYFRELETDFEFSISVEEHLKDFTPIRAEGKPCEVEILYPLAHEEFLYVTTPDLASPPVTAKIDSCPQIQLAKDEYVHNATANTIIIHSGRQILNEGEFALVDNTTVRVCRSDYYVKRTQYKVGLTTLHRAHNIFSYVFTMTSLLCLLVTFTTYCIFPDLRTVPGKNIMSLCFSLFVAQGSLQFSSFILIYEVICVPFAILTHYSWLATFCAMNVCSFHMYRLFYNKMMSSPAALRSLGHAKYYLLYTYTLPLAIVGLTLTIHYGVSNGEFSGYGKFVCFLSDKFTIIFTFIVPAGLIFTSNFAFFAMAFHAIRTSPRVACTKKDKREFYIYLKLCALTGISWPLQIVDGMLPLSAFSFIAVFINALQGFYIFLSYVCNQRVYKLYARLWTGKGDSYMEGDTPGTKSDVFQTKSSNKSKSSKNGPSLKGD